MNGPDCAPAPALAADARRGLWADPGLDEAHARTVRASALFEVGDKVVYFASEDERLSATIVSAFKVFKVRDDSGCYVDEDGRRFVYRSGYAIECEGEMGFSIAGDLTRDDCKPSHLCLVP